jgi:hypothetical protein
VSTYPGALDGLGANNPLGTDIRSDHAAKHSEERDAVDAIQETLGVNPQGTELTVVARLNEIEADIAGISLTAADTSFDDTGLDHFTGANVQAALEAGDTAVGQALAIGDSVAVLQVQWATKTDTQTFSSVGQGAWVGPVAGLSVAITPSSVDAKVRVQAVLTLGADDNRSPRFRLLRNGSPIAAATGDAAGNRTRVTSHGVVNRNQPVTVSAIFYDSPESASEVTYTVEVGHGQNVSLGVYVNRGSDDSDSSAEPRAISTVEAMEVAA